MKPVVNINGAKKQRKLGNCVTCGQPAGKARYCPKHLDEQRVAARNRYRRKHGIPVNAPIGVGRPRKG